MLIKIKRGLDLVLPGAPEQTIHPARSVSTVALVGLDYRMLKPSVSVAVGDKVRAAQALFTHRTLPAIRYTAPGTGRVVAIQRGPKRRLLSVVIELDSDDSASFTAHTPEKLAALTPSTICDTLLASGLWTAFRTRSFGAVPSPERRPKIILVTAIDTNPLAADPAVVITARKDCFLQGIILISRLAFCKTFVCKSPKSQLAVPAIDGVVSVDFQGAHPAGLPGTHAHYLTPQAEPAEIWQIGYQDVIAIGELFLTGRLSHERVVALAGPGVLKPRLVTTRIGASLEELLAGDVKPSAQIISGSVLSGRKVSTPTAYLGRYDTQVSVLDPPLRSSASQRRGLGVAAPRVAARTPARLRRSTGMVCVEAFERVWPFRTPPLPLLRALLVGDTETAEALGCLGLHEEDLALCSYVCPAKQDYGSALRSTLRELAPK